MYKLHFHLKLKKCLHKMEGRGVVGSGVVPHYTYIINLYKYKNYVFVFEFVFVFIFRIRKKNRILQRRMQLYSPFHNSALPLVYILYTK